jgi:hypothetical protein
VTSITVSMVDGRVRPGCGCARLNCTACTPLTPSTWLPAGRSVVRLTGRRWPRSSGREISCSSSASARYSPQSTVFVGIVYGALRAYSRIPCAPCITTEHNSPQKQGQPRHTRKGGSGSGSGEVAVQKWQRCTVGASPSGHALTLVDHHTAFIARGIPPPRAAQCAEGLWDHDGRA